MEEKEEKRLRITRHSHPTGWSRSYYTENWYVLCGGSVGCNAVSDLPPNVCIRTAATSRGSTHLPRALPLLDGKRWSSPPDDVCGTTNFKRDCRVASILKGPAPPAQRRLRAPDHANSRQAYTMMMPHLRKQYITLRAPRVKMHLPILSVARSPMATFSRVRFCGSRSGPRRRAGHRSP